MSVSSKTSKRIMLYSVTIAIALISDQLTKAAARAHLFLGQRQSFIPHLLDLRLIYNKGAAFSMGEGHGLLFAVFALAVLLVTFIFVLKKEPPTPLVIALACIAGGGVGNMIDRLMFGQVTDFFATSFIDFPVFNVADIFVSLGVVAAIILFNIWDNSEAKKKVPNQ